MNQRYQQARALMEQKRFDEAAVLFEQDLKVAPHFKDLELLGECLIHLGRLSEAIVPLAAATTLNAGVRAPSLLAKLFLRLGELQDAEQMAQIALARDPKNRKALAVKQRLAATESSAQ